MKSMLSRTELITMVSKLMTADGTESELDAILDDLVEMTSYPGVSDLVYFPNAPLSAEEIVDKILKYTPITSL